MTCVICDSPLSGRQTRACSKACKIQDDTNQRRESGRLRTANMTAEAREKKNARDRAWQEQLAPRQCRVCKETQLVRVTHSRTRLICKKCSPLWRGKTPANTTDLAKTSPPKLRIPQAIQGGVFYESTCIQCGISAWSRQQFRYCGPRCREKATGKTHWISKAKRLAIYERDNYTCQICMKPVDSVPYGHMGVWSPTAPSLDHITPRSLGGSHSATNLRLAHTLCNSLRGAKPTT